MRLAQCSALTAMCGATPLPSAYLLTLLTCSLVAAERTAPPPPPPGYSNTTHTPQVAHHTSELRRTDPQDWAARAPADGHDATTEQAMELADAVTACNHTFTIETAFLISLNESGSFPDETDSIPKCFVRCVVRALRVVSAEGALEPARAAAYFARTAPPSDALILATACARRDEADQCEVAYNFLKCLFSADIDRPHDNTQS